MNNYSYVCFYYSTSDAIVNGKLKKIKKICPSDFFDSCGQIDLLFIPHKETLCSAIFHFSESQSVRTVHIRPEPLFSECLLL